MPYSEGRVVHDADAHIMETPTWLRDHAEAAFRDRLPVLRYPGGNELRQTGDPSEQQRDLFGFSSQLVFNTFHNGRLHDMEHAGDPDLAYAAARAHNRGMLEFCSVDARLLPSFYVPLVDPERAATATRDALDQGAAALLVASG